MEKILLKRPGFKSSKHYQEDIARITKATITIKSSNIVDIEMFSVKELHLKKNSTSSIEKPHK